MTSYFEYERYNVTVGLRTLKDYQQHFILFSGKFNPLTKLTESYVNSNTFECAKEIRKYAIDMFEHIMHTETPNDCVFYSGWNFKSKETIEQSIDSWSYFYQANDENATKDYPLYIEFKHMSKNDEIAFAYKNGKKIFICINTTYFLNLKQRGKLFINDSQTFVAFVESTISHELSHAFDMFILGIKDLTDSNKLSVIKDIDADYFGLRRFKASAFNDARWLLYYMSEDEQRAYITQVYNFIRNIANSQNPTRYRIVDTAKCDYEEQIRNNRPGVDYPLLSDPKYAADYLTKCILDDETMKMTHLVEFHNRIEEMFLTIDDEHTLEVLAIVAYYLLKHGQLKSYNGFNSNLDDSLTTINIKSSALHRVFTEQNFLRMMSGKFQDVIKENEHIRIALEYTLFVIESSFLNYEYQICKNLRKLQNRLFSEYGLTVTGPGDAPIVKLSDNVIQESLNRFLRYYGLEVPE